VLKGPDCSYQSSKNCENAMISSDFFVFVVFFLSRFSHLSGALLVRLTLKAGANSAEMH
jgi:hypothetical protein